MAASRKDKEMKEILTRAGLPTLVDTFVEQKIEPAQIESMTDDDMRKIGVVTIGDRLRVRESAKQQKISNSDNTPDNTPTFPGFRHFQSSRKSAKKRQEGGWTASFFCLSSVHQQTTPTCSEKEVLHKTGLGLMKIKLINSHTEEEVFRTVKDIFPKLKDSGGFEFLRTQQNGRKLVPIAGPWSSRELKFKIGPQARIYIRPIQHTLSTEPINKEASAPSLKIACNKCKREYQVQELRSHVAQCKENTDDLPDPNSFFNLNRQRNVVGPNLYINYEIEPFPEDTESGILQNIENTAYSQIPLQEGHEIPVQVVNSGEVSFSDVLVMNPQIQELYSVNSHEVLPEVSNELNLHNVVRDEVPKELNDIVKECIIFCKQHNISNPLEILGKIQKEIVTGRPLEIEDLETSLVGDTNFITVDRNNILETSMEEISGIPDQELRNTLEVQFYNEQACDYGGPRKEFFRLVFFDIKEKYFDNGWRELIAEDYRTVGIILALSILQNGKMPTFLGPEVVEEVFNNTVESSSPAVNKFREGLNTVGMYDLFTGLPELKFLLHPSEVSLSMKRVVTMLQPVFSAEGTNAIQFEKEVYGCFIKYLREIGAGRRGSLTLASILQFVTCTDEEPLLGFKIKPSIEFHDVQDGFLPTASTCVNKLTLPRPNQLKKLPKARELFELYDLAFSNTFYGLQ